MSNTKRWLALGCSAATALCSPFAQGQESRSRASAPALEEIVVTAQKRSENMQDVPIAITAFTDELRDTIGISTIEDMANFVPGLTYDATLDRANLRGIGRLTNVLGSDPGVALYINGFYSSSMVNAGRSSLFNERVEVLRGPQGTLYGRNAMGGAINTISRQANDEFGAELRTSYGDYDRKVVEGTFTGPITDWLRFRASAGMYKQDEGYFKNLAGPSEGQRIDDRAYEVQLEGDIGELVDWKLLWGRGEWDQLDRASSNSFAPYSKTLSACLNGAPLCSNATLLSTPAAFLLRSASGPSALFNTGLGLNPADPPYLDENPASPSNPRVVNTNTPARQTLDHNHTVVSNVVFHLPGVDVRWIGGWQTYVYGQISDFDNSSREYYDYTPPNGLNPVRIFTSTESNYVEDKEYYSNELNVTSTGDGPLQWLLGAYQYREKYDQVLGEVYNPNQVELRTVYARPPVHPTTIAGLPTQVVDPNPKGKFTAPFASVDVKSAALFGQLDWNFTETWKATLGARYSRDEKSGSEQRRNIVWDPTLLGSLARAYDNTPPLECHSSDADPDPVTGTNVTRGPNGAITAVSACRSRTMAARTWEDWSGTTGIEWAPNTDFLAYLKYSRGYKAGAIRLGSFGADPEVDPEYVNAYELGSKWNLGTTLQLNASTFYYDYEGYQVPITFRDENDQTRTEYTNLATVKTAGVELESVWAPLDGLSIMLSYGYLHTKNESDVYVQDSLDPLALGPEASDDVREIRNGLGAVTAVYQNLTGNELPNSPEQKATANVSYRFDFAPGALTLSGTYSWRDKAYSSLHTRSYYATDAYDTTDARATFADAKGRYSIIAFVRNVFDDLTYNSVSASTVNNEVVRRFSFNPPRTWGVELQYRFGSEAN